MRYIVLFILLLQLYSLAHSQDINGIIADAQLLLAPNTRLSVDGSVLTMDHVVEGEVRLRHQVNAADLDPGSTELDTTQQSITFRCQALRSRCITTVQYVIDLEKRSSQGSVLIHGGAKELSAGREALIALINGIAEEFGANETSLLLMRRKATDQPSEP